MEIPMSSAPILCVTSIPEAVKFYERCFGFLKQRYFDGNESYVVLQRGSAQIHLIESERTNANHALAAHVADVFIWVPSLEPVLALAARNNLVAMRGPERYDSSPVATTEVVFEDNSGYWLCFAEAHQ